MFPGERRLVAATSEHFYRCRWARESRNRTSSFVDICRVTKDIGESCKVRGDVMRGYQPIWRMRSWIRAL